ncbi:MAG: type II toxin-antitoxin system VapC family toxin [Actinobacteria bacterium]|nr:type II toxin-antitoxin system VapC family toxin [Actinomycetota bacterium]
MIVLDTNVLSEIMQGSASSPVLTWVVAQDADRLAITAVTVVVVSDGIARMQPGRRRDQLAAQWDLLEGQWLGTFLPMGMQAARMTGAVSARRRGMGRPLSMADACIAGICLAHEARLATRKTRDFEGIGLALIDPWAG